MSTAQILATRFAVTLRATLLKRMAKTVEKRYDTNPSVRDWMKFYITEDDMCTTQKLNLARVQKWIEANGGLVVETPEGADHVLCMTCNGWALLEQRSYDRIKQLDARFHDKMIVVGCVVDSHPKKVKDIFSGPTVRTRSETALSFAGIEALFPQF